MTKDEEIELKLLNKLVERENFIDLPTEDYFYASLSQPPIRIVNRMKSDDELDWIVECPNCHENTKFADTCMCHGKIYCDYCRDKIDFDKW